MKYISCSMSGISGPFNIHSEADLIFMADSMADLLCLQCANGERDGGPIDEIRHVDRIFANRQMAKHA